MRNALFALILFLALAPTAPGGLTAVLQYLPACSLGNGGFDANHDGTIDSGCPGSDEMVATSTGFAGHFANFRKAGTATNLTDAAADGGTAVYVTPSSNYLSGQIAANVTLANGANTVWVLASTPLGDSARGLRIDTTAIPNTNPDAGTRHLLTNSTNYVWTKLSSTIAGTGSQITLYFVPDAGVQLVCVYADLSAVATPQCDTGTIPQVPDYIMLQTAGTPASCSDLTEANSVPFNGFHNSNNTLLHAWFAWKNDTTDKIYFCLKSNDATPVAPTTGADNDAIFNGTDDYFEFTLAPGQGNTLDSSFVKTGININATPSIWDGLGPFSASTYDGNCSATVTTVASTSWQIFGTCDLGFDATEDQIGKMQILIGDNDGAGATYSQAHGALLAPNDPFGYLLVQFSSTALPAAPADTTAPTVGQPQLVSTGNNSQTWSVTCADSGSGCASMILLYGPTSQSAPPPNNYASSQNCGPLSGTNPNYTAQCVISGLTAGISYYVRALGTDGASNSTYSTENNAAATSTPTYYWSSSGSGSACTSVAPCAPSILSSSQPQPGDTWILKNGLHNLSSTVTINCASGATNGTLAAPITVTSETDRQGHIFMNGRTAFHVIACSYWVFDGLYIEIGDNASLTADGEAFFLRGSNHVTLRGNLMTKSNRFAYESPVLIWPDGNGHLIEDNEIYECGGMNCINDKVGGNTIRRNYINPRGSYDVSGGCSPAMAAGRVGPCGSPAAGIVVYPGSNSIIENNIVEGNSYTVNLVADHAPASNNLIVGNIGVSTCAGLVFESRTEPAASNIVQNHVEYRPGAPGCAGNVGGDIRGGLNQQFTNMTFYGQTAAVVGGTDDGGGLSFNTNGDPGNGNIGTNLLITGFPGGGFFSNQNTWTLRNSNVSGNTPFNLSPSSSGNYSSVTQTTPTNLSGCVLYIPSTSNMKSAGLGGADIGATVLYKTVNGVQQVSSGPNALWDSTQTGSRRMEAKRASGGNGGWARAIISGVNEIGHSGGVLADVNLRLGFGTGSCPTPPGY